jgi:adenosylcobyric acid synthase
LCRLFNEAGVKVAPFKAQNMALNSFITREGGEIGRAQALQAEAARVEPTVDMNPVLLKTAGDQGTQVILHGQVWRVMTAKEYYAARETAWQAVEESWGRLACAYDLVVMEGAGSPAEINLRDVDIVNMAAARLARASVLLVGDIDRGGVFASLYGTMKLLGREGRRIKGFVINKFRGDRDILAPGITMMEQLTGRPVLGVLPYVRNLGLSEEDSLALGYRHEAAAGRGTETLRVVVVRLPFIANFTDFDPLAHEPDVELVFSTNPADILNADLLFLPGTKKTMADLAFLRKNSLDAVILQAHARGVPLVGICGGLQMMGEKILDPDQVEDRVPEMAGLGLLKITSVFSPTKTTCQDEGQVLDPAWFGLKKGTDLSLRGYEIHKGYSIGDAGLFQIRRLPSGEMVTDGFKGEHCWGTYLHGIWENDAFRRGILNAARAKKGLAPLAATGSYAAVREEALRRLAIMVKENLAFDDIRRMVGL